MRTSSSMAVLFVVVHFVFSAEEFSAETCKWISTFSVHDGGMRPECRSIPVHPPADRTWSWFVESQFSRWITSKRIETFSYTKN